MSLAGRLLVATPLITDTNFLHTVVYLYAHEAEEGAAGVVLNRMSEEPAFEHLPDWRGIFAAPPNVFWGGPVASSSGVVLLAEGDEVRLAEEMQPPPASVRARLFVGQAGWGPDQLEGEIAEGAWLVVDGSAADVMTPSPDTLWSELLRRVGGRAAFWATHTADPKMN